jgi:hypothetical protein
MCHLPSISRLSHLSAVPRIWLSTLHVDKNNVFPLQFARNADPAVLLATADNARKIFSHTLRP